jgi:hypothetical protein
MSPALSMKAPPVIWIPEADVKSGMEEQRRVGDTSRAKKLYCSALPLRVPHLFLQHCALIWLHLSISTDSPSLFGIRYHQWFYPLSNDRLVREISTAHSCEKSAPSIHRPDIISCASCNISGITDVDSLSQPGAISSAVQIFLLFLFVSVITIIRFRVRDILFI